MTICGDAGLGKTSLASTFPKPIFIRAEDGLQAIPSEYRPDAFPVISDTESLWGQLTSLIREDHDYKTLVIDSVTKLDAIFIQHVVMTDPKKPASINQALGGYGAGIAAVTAMHMRVRKACEMLNTVKNMNIVFIAHAETESLDLPDQDAYTRYNLRIGKKSASVYVDDVDLVGFLKLETYTTESKKAVSDGTRVLVCYATAANISKNRYGIEKDIIIKKNENPFKNLGVTINE
jgi:hypothetical protein